MIGVEEPVREEGQRDVRWGFGPPDYLVGSSLWFIGLIGLLAYDCKTWATVLEGRDVDSCNCIDFCKSLKRRECARKVNLFDLKGSNKKTVHFCRTVTTLQAAVFMSSCPQGR